MWERYAVPIDDQDAWRGTVPEIQVSERSRETFVEKFTRSFTPLVFRYVLFN